MTSFKIFPFVFLISISGLAQQPFYGVTAGNGYGVRFWNADAYKIHMGNTAEYKYGPVQDYSIKMNMSGGTPSRGWTWGVSGQTPVGALSTLGHFQVAGNMTALGGLYFSQSGTATDGFPPARFNEMWGIRFNSPDSRWVFSSKPSVLIGYQPNGTDWGNDNLYVAGNIGIGTTSPNYKLQVSGGAIALDDDQPLLGGGRWLISGNSTAVTVGTANPGIDLRFFAGDADRMLVDGTSGNVGIGTTTPDSKLTVKGTIHAQEVKVDLNGSVAPDYVFEKGYTLIPLEELKLYIDQNKHLPEIPSAMEMEEDGINLKEMNLLLLKKVEELTLHVIELKNENRKSNLRIDDLQKEVTKLKTEK